MIAGFSETGRQLDLEIGHVAGLRWFTLTGEWFGAEGKAAGRPVLRGAYGAWEPGENTAVHIGPVYPVWSFAAGESFSDDGHTSPPRGGTSCHCGFWAYWKLGAKAVDDPAVPAIVHGYGHVLEGTAGFRCSHAAIKAICIPSPDPELQNAVEDRYQVPVYSTVEAMIAMHPAPAGQPPLGDGGWTISRGGSLLSPASLEDDDYYYSVTSVTASGGGGYVAGGSGGGSGGSRCSACGAAARMHSAYCTGCLAHVASAWNGYAKTYAEACAAAAVSAADSAKAVATPIDALAKLDERKAGWKGRSMSFAVTDEVTDAVAEPAPLVDWEGQVKPYAGHPYGYAGPGTDDDGNFSPMSLARATGEISLKLSSGQVKRAMQALAGRPRKNGKRARTPRGD